MVETGTYPSLTPAQVADQLARLNRTLHGLGFVHGLNPAQWMALRYFHRADEQDRTVMRFADHYGSSRGTASQTISALVRKGYLRRSPNPRKRSSRLLDVTEAGHDLLATDPQHQLVAALGGLPEDTLTLLSNGLSALMLTLGQAPRSMDLP
jgi:DNA-binding MarR family transcriptional regulator